MNNAEVDAGREFIEHFGVKGMKWGVRKVKAGAGRVGKAVESRANKSFEKKAGSVETYVRVQNRAAQKSNEIDIPRINNKPEYRNANFNELGSNHKLTKQYEKEMFDSFDKRLQESLNREGTNVSGTRRYELEGSSHPNGPGWTVKVVDVKKAKHAAGDTFQVSVTRDAKGFITKIELAENSMKQTIQVGEDFIAHYGVKGMRWGQRKSPTEVSTQSVVNAGLRSKTKIKAKGGQAHPATDDAIKAAVQKQKLKKSGAAALSNKELSELRDRLQLEQQVTQLAAPKGRKFVTGQLKTQGQQTIQRESSRQIEKALSTRR